MANEKITGFIPIETGARYTIFNPERKYLHYIHMYNADFTYLKTHGADLYSKEVEYDSYFGAAKYIRINTNKDATIEIRKLL